MKSLYFTTQSKRNIAHSNMLISSRPPQHARADRSQYPLLEMLIKQICSLFQCLAFHSQLMLIMLATVEGQFSASVIWFELLFVWCKPSPRLIVCQIHFYISDSEPCSGKRDAAKTRSGPSLCTCSQSSEAIGKVKKCFRGSKPKTKKNEDAIAWG